MKKNTLAITSIVIALLALAIILSILIVNIPSGKASVQNIVNPLPTYSKSNYQPGTTIIQVEKSSSDSSSSSSDHDPEIELGDTIYLMEDATLVLNMDSFASDEEDSHSELEYEILSPTDDSIINVTYNAHTREVSITAVGSAGESAILTIKVTDTDGNTDTDSVLVEITSGNSNSPVISNIEDIYMLEDGTAYLSQSLDYYVSDPDNADSEITWSFSGNTNINVDIDPVTRNVTFTATPNWYGTEWITFIATDPNGNYDSDVVMVEVTPVDDPAAWNSLSNQEINEDSADGTIVYQNIVGQVTDIDSPINVNVVSTSSHYDLSISGNDLIISNLEANWYGTETVTLDCNGVTATFTLRVNQLYDDCIKLCGYISCEEVCD